MNFSNFKISAKLGLGFGLVVAMTILLGVMALVQLSRVAAETEQIATNNLPSVELAANLRGFLNDIRRAEAAHTFEDDEAQRRALEERIDKSISSFAASEAKADAVFNSEFETKALASYRKNRDEWLTIDKKLLAASRQGKDGQLEAQKLYQGEGRKLFSNALAEVVSLVEYNSKEAGESWVKAQGVYGNAKLVVVGSIAVSVVLAMLLALSISRGIARPIAQAVGAAKDMAEGNMTVGLHADGSNETAQLLQSLEAMRTSLAAVVTNVRQGSESVATASAEIAQGNNDLSARTEQQASALEQTAASMEELGSTVKQNADSARQANQLAMSASTVAVQGGEVVGQVVETMKGINESSRKISDIISVIDGIAFQTNILALNAAVEAARAGEQGRGFAVVASEVRSLAGRSAEAAKEIKMLINASVERVEQGTALVDKAGHTMEEVVGSIRRVTDIMGEISAASNEQALGVAQVGEAVSQMDQATQQNAALVEEMAAAASSLKSQAQELVQTVAVFKLDGNEPHGMTTKRPVTVRSHPVAAVPYRSTPRKALGSPMASGNDSTGMGINLDNAIQAHAEWRNKLRSAATSHEKLDAETISRDDCCEMGKWLHGNGKSKFGNRPVFVDLIAGHKTFHMEAGKVARAVNQGSSNVESMLESGTPFSAASNEVGRLIVQLKRELKGPAKSPPRLQPPIAVAKATPSGGDDDWETF